MTAEAWEARRSERKSPSPLTYVLGVAFPHADVDASGYVELERCFLQLAFAGCRLEASGDNVRGYLAVLRQETRDAVRRLRTRYGVGESVQVVFASLLVSDMTRLAEANEIGAREGDPAVLTAVGREIATDALRREICVREPDVVERTMLEDMPFGVRWDFYGLVRRRDETQTAADKMNPRLL